MVGIDMGEAVGRFQLLTKRFALLQVQRLMDVVNDGFEYFAGVFRGPRLTVLGDFGGVVDVRRGQVDVFGQCPKEACANLQAAQPRRQHFLSGPERRQQHFHDHVKPADMSGGNTVQLVTNPESRN